MYHCNITKVNEAFIHVECDRSLAQELSDHFSFRVNGYQFSPAYKNKLWDGYIKLFNVRTNTIYHGLLPYVEQFCNERDYKASVESKLTITESFSIKEAQEFVDNLNLPFEVRDYQLNGFVHAIRNKRILLLSPTASGKSLIQYLIVRKFQDMDLKKGLLIVPSTSLTHQMFKDFESYGYDSNENCHLQYSGKDKKTDKFLTITTWQSIYTLPKEYFEQFDFVLGDECHEFKAKSLTTIMTNLVNATYRVGCTGTLDGSHTNKLVLEGLFGPVYKTISTKELIDNKQLADFNIKCLVLKYPDSVCKMAKDWNYQDEMNYIVSNEQRNQFIKNLALSLNGNSLILFQYVEKHGKELFRLIEKEKNKRRIFFVFGGTDVEVRESVREITERENGAIIIASYGTFSRGINIKNLHGVIFASPSKSKVRNLQSIGRGLRKSESKEEATLYDIADDFRIGKFTNYTLKHFIERLKIYDEEKFFYKLYNIEMKNG